MQKTSSENVKVVIRFRPLNDKELKMEEDPNFYLKIEPKINKITVCKSNTTERGYNETHNFIFDQVFDEKTTQEQLFNQVAKNSVYSVAEGYNTTIFTYGMTGSGKTFCMFGENDPRLKGIIPRSCELLFEILKKKEDVVELSIKCSFLEIYRENIKDLLSSGKENLKIRQHQLKGIYVQGLIEKYVYSAEEILKTIQDGAKQRAMASTSLNNVSSRSHAVLIIHITQKILDGTEIISKMNLIDLAGSENVGRSEASGITLLEAQQINKSLSSLGNVIYALTDKTRDHIPYRDSRLTYLLQDSLGGNSKTILITTVIPHYSAYSEIVSSLKFAQRAKDIKNIPKINKNETTDNLAIRVEELTKELEELRAKYEESRKILDDFEDPENSDRISNKSVGILKSSIQRHKKIIEQLETAKNHEELKINEAKDMFKKQRKLAQNVSNELYLEKLENQRLKDELEEYKQLYKNLEDSIEYPFVLQHIMRHTKFRPVINTDRNIELPLFEIPSPL